MMPEAPDAAFHDRLNRVFAAQRARAMVLRRSTAADRIAMLRKLVAAIESHRDEIHAAGDADAMVTGLTRSFIVNYDDIRRVIDTEGASGAFGLSIAILRHLCCG